MIDYLKRTWAEIDLTAVEYNYRVIEGFTDAKIMPIVKADGYGHGAVEMAKWYEKLGAAYFGVSSLDEAMQLRNGGVAMPVLILGYTPASQTGVLLEYGITQTVYEPGMAEAFSKEAARKGRKLPVHIKVDTGMSRLGLRCHEGPGEEVCGQIEKICRLEGLDAEGIFTHFASSDEPENPFTLLQFNRFCQVLSELDKRGITFKLRHCANSGAILNFPRTHLDMIRPGLILYGLPPDQNPLSLPLKPTMRICSVVSAVHDAKEGDTVSYGQTYRVEAPMKLATVSIGYADGYPRRLSNRGNMLVNGKRAPIVGRVCMDQCMVDITGIDGVKPGDTVVAMGDSIPFEEIASLCDTINYEIICGISKRVPRVYIINGKEVNKLAYIV